MPLEGARFSKRWSFTVTGDGNLRTEADRDGLALELGWSIRGDTLQLRTVSLIGPWQKSAAAPFESVTLERVR
ncbi:MAG: hypothetical protein ACE5JG_00435 [Planctomycetota bacterium]